MNVPGFFSLVWRIAEPMLSPSTRKKIRLCHSKAVRARRPGSTPKAACHQPASCAQSPGTAASCCSVPLAAFRTDSPCDKLGFALGTNAQQWVQGASPEASRRAVPQVEHAAADAAVRLAGLTQRCSGCAARPRRTRTRRWPRRLRRSSSRRPTAGPARCRCTRARRRPSCVRSSTGSTAPRPEPPCATSQLCGLSRSRVPAAGCPGGANWLAEQHPRPRETGTIGEDL